MKTQKTLLLVFYLMMVAMIGYSIVYGQSDRLIQERVPDNEAFVDAPIDQFIDEDVAIDIPLNGTPKAYFNGDPHYAPPHPTFSWAPVDGAIWYQIWISKVAKPGTPVILEWVQGTSWTLGTDDNTLIVGQEYSWWVRAWSSAAGKGPWSERADFTVVPSWKANGSDMYYNSGNVGIGTASPGTKLDVKGGSVNINNAGEGKVLVYLGTERHWEVRQLDTGANTALEFASVGGNGNKNFVITTNGAVIIQPKDVGIDSTLIVNGNLEVTGGIKGKCRLPPPDYDSGWHWVKTCKDTIFTHNLGGNPDDYVVDLTFDKSGGGAIHNKFYGMTLDNSQQGGYWSNLNNQSIMVSRNCDDIHCIRFRVRIWAY